jgi:hypothetical protein
MQTDGQHAELTKPVNVDWVKIYTTRRWCHNILRKGRRTQGRRNLLNVGEGAGLRGTFRIKNVGDGGEGEVISKNIPDIQKNFPDIWCFSRKWKKFSGNNINSSFQKCPLAKKCNLNDIFHARKGHFAPGENALAKTWGPALLPPPVPTSLGGLEADDEDTTTK